MLVAVLTCYRIRGVRSGVPLLSYQHEYHAGNHADVFKHVVLVALLERFKQKEKPFIYIDTHAGSGLYELRSGSPSEQCDGVAKVLAAPSIQTDGDYLTIYKQRIADLSRVDGQHHYPGSIHLASQLLRPSDTVFGFELHPQEGEKLNKLFTKGNTRRIQVRQQDGFNGLVALSPPTPKRGLVLIDPPYERVAEYLQVVRSVSSSLRKWAVGSFVIWYPKLSHRAIEKIEAGNRMLRDLSKLPCKSILQIELEVIDTNGYQGMYGSGMHLINPPFDFDDLIRNDLEQLKQVMDAVRYTINWIKPPQ